MSSVSIISGVSGINPKIFRYGSRSLRELPDEGVLVRNIEECLSRSGHQGTVEVSLKTGIFRKPSKLLIDPINRLARLSVRNLAGVIDLQSGVVVFTRMPMLTSAEGAVTRFNKVLLGMWNRLPIERGSHDSSIKVTHTLEALG